MGKDSGFLLLRHGERPCFTKKFMSLAPLSGLSGDGLQGFILDHINQRRIQ